MQFAGRMPSVVQNETGQVLSTAHYAPAWLTLIAQVTVGLISAPSLSKATERRKKGTA
ncbi:hypothetical protein [Pseudomonas thivervalensis]|uniref:hypothetical protein n=1 Tax=Pseudomonas thivervalensis TaxID=86265 RepID=UPI003D655267